MGADHQAGPPRAAGAKREAPPLLPAAPLLRRRSSVARRPSLPAPRTRRCGRTLALASVRAAACALTPSPARPQGKIKTLESIYLYSLPIKEYQSATRRLSLPLHPLLTPPAARSARQLWMPSWAAR